MNKLTAEKCRERIKKFKRLKKQFGIAMETELSLQAFEIALPILEQQEMITDSQTVITDNAEIITDNVEVDWIEWKGGECPVQENTAIEVKLRNGTVSSAWLAKGWVWEHGILSPRADIIAYRIIPERAANQKGDES